MSKRRSWFGNFSIESLLVLLNQSYEELEKLKSIEKQTKQLKIRMGEVEYNIAVFKNLIIKKYLQTDISVSKIAQKLLESDEITNELYQELFVLKLIDGSGFIDVGLLEKTIDNLDIKYIQMIMDMKINTIYAELATNKFNKMIFDVEEDVYNEYVLKKRMDEGR